MSQRKFVLSWGRKLFFGLSFPLGLVLGLIYLGSSFFPQNALESFFYLVSFIGHIGLLNIIGYFFLYCPIVLIFPSYYISRLWSLILVLGINFIILFDGLTFAQYQLHLYSFLKKFFIEKGPAFLFHSQGAMTLLTVASVIIALLIWLRGENTWRYMQRRFSNPVKNWYIVFIILCFGISYALIGSESISSTVKNVFPMSQLLNTNHSNAEDAVFYPKGDLKCEGKKNANIVLVTFRDWPAQNFNVDLMPKTFHMKRHGQSFLSHHEVSDTNEGGLFTLLYSLPESFSKSMAGKDSVFFEELKKRNYEFVSGGYQEQDQFVNFVEWSKKSRMEDTRPFFVNFIFDQANLSTDVLVQDIINVLEAKDLLANTNIVLVGARSSQGDKVPFIWFDQDRKFDEISYTTTNYDVAPSIMQKLWGCKNVFKHASFGEPLSQSARHWYMTSSADGFNVVDLEHHGQVSVHGNEIQSTGSPDEDLIFHAIKKLVSFRKVQR